MPSRVWTCRAWCSLFCLFKTNAKKRSADFTASRHNAFLVGWKIQQGLLCVVLEGSRSIQNKVIQRVGPSRRSKILVCLYASWLFCDWERRLTARFLPQSGKLQQPSVKCWRQLQLWTLAVWLPPSLLSSSLREGSASPKHSSRLWERPAPVDEQRAFSVTLPKPLFYADILLA